MRLMFSDGCMFIDYQIVRSMSDCLQVNVAVMSSLILFTFIRITSILYTDQSLRSVFESV